MVNLGELMRNLRNVALRGNPAECAEPMSGVLDLFRAPTPVTVTLARQVAGSAR